jgi:hypothetical protein
MTVEGRVYYRFGYYFHIIYSPDDGGWYAEAWDEQGKDAVQTEIQPTAEEARKAIYFALKDLKNIDADHK